MEMIASNERVNDALQLTKTSQELKLGGVALRVDLKQELPLQALSKLQISVELELSKGLFLSIQLFKSSPAKIAVLWLLFSLVRHNECWSRSAWAATTS